MRKTRTYLAVEQRIIGLLGDSCRHPGHMSAYADMYIPLLSDCQPGGLIWDNLSNVIAVNLLSPQHTCWDLIEGDHHAL